MEEEKPTLEDGKKTVQRWHASKEVEQDALACWMGILPIEMRASDATLEEFYDKACSLYKSGRYKEALPMFSLLTMAHIKEPRFQMARGATFHMLKDYLSAGQCYNMCSILDPENPFPQYHLADCCLHMNNPIGAYIAFRMALKRCKMKPDHKALQDRIETMLSKLEKDFEAKKKLGTTYFHEGAEKEFP